MPKKILIVEDDTTFASILEKFLLKHDFEVEVRYSVKTGLEVLQQDNFKLLLLDYRLGDGTALDLLNELQKQEKLIPSIIMTSFNDVRTAVKAIRQGVFDYITKPVNPDELMLIVNDALTSGEEQLQLHQSEKPQNASNTSAKERKKKLETTSRKDWFVEGSSRSAVKLHDYIALVAPTDMSVLIRGESGTGKEYVARLIHDLSKRKDKKFISIDCGTLSKELASSELFGHIKGSFTGALQDKVGQFVEASGGTLFLDEIGNLSYDVQVKLLRALQERVIQPVGSNKTLEVDVRIIAATNEDLLGAQAEGKFREDLYHRINEFEIQVPALRDREDDFDEFLEFFIDQANAELERDVTRLDDEVMDVLKSYDWPGNLRELKNIVRRMILLTKGNTADLGTLPEDMVSAAQRNSFGQLSTQELVPTSIPVEIAAETMAGTSGIGTEAPGVDLKLRNEEHERNLIMDVLQKTRYNKSKAAKILNIDRKTLYNKMEKYGIS